MKVTAQSNVISLSKSNLTIPERRILYVIVDSVSPYLQDEISKAKGKEIDYKKGAFDISKITYQAKDICRPEHYGELRVALESLKSKSICFETNKMFYGSSLILKYKFDKGSEILELGIDEELYQMLIDYKNNYTLLQVKVALSFSSLHTMKIYELLAKWRTRPQFYVSIEELRHLTNTITSYTKIASWKKRVLETAKRELDTSDITDLRFNYKEKKHGRKIVGFDISIIKTNNSHEFKSTEKKEVQQLSAKWIMSAEMERFFNRIGLVWKGNKNAQLIEELCKKVGTNTALDLLEKWEETAKRERSNIPAYIIGCMKREIKN